jgi:hypothetical protein
MRMPLPPQSTVPPPCNCLVAVGDACYGVLGACGFYSVLTGMSSCQCAGTLSDFLFSEVLKLYPKLRQYAEVVLVQSADHILPVFDGALQKQAEKNLEQLEVRILTGVRVRPPLLHSLSRSHAGQLLTCHAFSESSMLTWQAFRYQLLWLWCTLPGLSVNVCR